MAVDVKTLNGLAYASVKTRNGLAVASIQAINGVDTTSGFTPTIISGSSLAAWSADASFYFDSGNEFQASAIGHIIHISGGSNFTPGAYCISGFISALNMGGQGVHNVVTIGLWNGSSEVPPGTTSATGAAWTYAVGSSGAGFSGRNLIAWTRDNAWYYDPDAPISSGMNGSTVAISGTDYNAGTYTVTGFLSAFPTGSQGVQNLMQVSQTGGHFPAIAQIAELGEWERASGETIPTPDVNSGYTGNIKLMLIGDSITEGMSTKTATALATQYPNAASISVLNRGVSGTASGDWLPGSTYLTNAITAANGAGTTIISIMLGTNDAKVTPVSAATYASNMQDIVDELFNGIGTLTAVVLQEQPYIVPGTPYWSSDDASDNALEAYYAEYVGITGATPGASTSDTNFAFFSRNPQLLVDGVHPTSAGQDEINYTWLLSLQDTIDP